MTADSIIAGQGAGGADLLFPEGFRREAAALLAATMTINILSLALPVMTTQVYDRILPNPGTGTLSVLVAGVCVAVVLEMFLRLARAYVIGRTGAAYEHCMACGVMDRILNADLSKLGFHGTGEYMHRMAAVGKVRDFYSGYALTVAAELAFVPLFFALILYIGRELAVVPAVVLLAFVAVSFWKGRRLREALKKREEADDRRFNFLIEALEGVHTVKAFALEKLFERRYEALEEDSTVTNYRVTQETAGAFNAGAVFSHLMVAGVVTAGAWLVLNGSLTTGALIASMMLSGRMMQPVQKGLALWTRYQDCLLARRHVENLMNTPQRAPAEPGAGGEGEIGGQVTLRGVSFRYASAEKDVLKNISLELKRGESVLVTGAQGAGKTTLLSLVAGIYPAGGGRVVVDGADVNAYRPEDLARHVGYIRANATIFRGTIRDNITCFGQADERTAREVSSLLGIDRDVARLPAGFDTFLNGGDADAIPPGLRQRIAMTRVLATKPRIVLFDNADRALDRDGYAMVYSLLARIRGKASMILVTDDRNIRALAERHYELKDGELSESDDMRSKGNVRLYRELQI